MKEKKEYITSEFNSRFFLPRWLVRGVEASFFQPVLQEPFSFESLQLGLPSLDLREWKIFASILSHLQQDALRDQSKTVFQLNPQELVRDLSFSQKFYQHSLVKFLRHLSGVKVYMPMTEAFIGKSLFDGEKWELHDNNWVLLLKPHFDTYELLFGIACAYSDWVRYYMKQGSLVSVLGKSSFLSCWKALWLDLYGVEWLLFMRLEVAKQWQIRKGVKFGLQHQYRENISELFSGVYLGNQRNLHFYNYYKILKKLSQKLYEHGLVENSYHDDLYQNFNDDTKLPCFFYSCPNDHWKQDHAKYKGQVCQFLVDRLLSDPQGNFFQLMSLGLSQEKIFQFNQEVLSCLQGEKGVSFKKLFIETAKGQMLPLVLLATEWHLRAQNQHLLGFSQDFEQTEFGKKIKGSPTLSYQERLDFLIQDVEKDTLFVDFIFTHPLATVVMPSSLQSAKTKIYEKHVSEVLSSVQKNSYFLKDHYFYMKKSQQNFSPKKSQIPSFSSTSLKSDTADGGNQDKNTRSLKKKCEEELDRLIAHSKESYFKIQDSYIDSLDPNAREILLTFKEKLRPELFDLHLRHRLVSYMSKDYMKKSSHSASVTLQ